MSDLPSRLKSPIWISTQVAPVLQAAQKEVLNREPADRPAYHWPFCKARPTMSALPSPLKSPTCTSTQVAPVLQVAHGAGDVTKLVPFDRAVHHWPPCSQRPVMSVLPSPLKSPT